MAQPPDPSSSDVRDPVCGKPVDPLRARAVGIFNGATVYFCSPECKTSYVDPRKAGPDAPAPAVERRIADRGEEGTGEWFSKREPASAPPASDSFSDLDAPGATPMREQPPSPSLMIQVQAARRGVPWLPIAIALAVVATILYLTVLRG